MLVRFQRYILILLIAGFACTSYAQTKKQYIKAAEKFEAQKDYYNAIYSYKQLLEFEPTNADFLYKVAEFSRLNNSYVQAEKYYLILQAMEEGKKFPELNNNLAQVQTMLGKYDLARTNINMYLSENQGEINTRENQARDLIKTLDFAEKNAFDSVSTYKLEHLGSDINTPFSDFAPFVLGDTLFYSSTRFENPSDKHVPKWHIGKILLKDNNNNGVLGDEMNLKDKHTTNLTVSPDGKRIYFSVCKNLNTYDIICDLYYRDVVNGVAGTAIKIPEPVNISGFTTTQPSVGELDGKNYLFFSSDRPGGKGKNDIWYAQINENGFGTPVNAENINSESMEITPFFHSNSKSLFYSSNGNTGFGGYDIYQSSWKGMDWQAAEHLPAPLNSSYNDLYYMISPSGKTGYLASNRLGSMFLDPTDEACCNDIYKVNIENINLRAFVFDANTRDSLPGAMLTLYGPNGEEIAWKEDPGQSSYVFPLVPGLEYTAIATKDGYLPDTVKFSTKDLASNEDIIKLFYLKSKLLDLDVQTFAKRTGLPLNGTAIKVIELVNGGKEMITQLPDNTNQQIIPIERGTKYLVIATKKGFAPDSAYVDTKNLPSNQNRIVQKLYLGKGNLEDYLPIELYFDNDEPGRKSYTKTTTKTFSETFNSYFNKKWIFKDKYGSPLSGELRDQSDKTIDNFFEHKVKKGNDDLVAFTETLIEVLERGEKIEIVIQGFTSPLASTAYNEKLGARRVSSIVNYLRSVEGNAITKYLKNGQLKIKEVSFGESKSPADVVSSYSDLRNSVYSVAASKERRVEIVNLSVSK